MRWAAANGCDPVRDDMARTKPRREGVGKAEPHVVRRFYLGRVAGLCSGAWWAWMTINDRSQHNIYIIHSAEKSLDEMVNGPSWRPD